MFYIWAWGRTQGFHPAEKTWRCAPGWRLCGTKMLQMKPRAMNQWFDKGQWPYFSSWRFTSHWCGYNFGTLELSCKNTSSVERRNSSLLFIATWLHAFELCSSEPAIGTLVFERMTVKQGNCVIAASDKYTRVINPAELSHVTISTVLEFPRSTLKKFYSTATSERIGSVLMPSDISWRRAVEQLKTVHCAPLCLLDWTAELCPYLKAAQHTIEQYKQITNVFAELRRRRASRVLIFPLTAAARQRRPPAEKSVVFAIHFCSWTVWLLSEKKNVLFNTNIAKMRLC